MLRRAKVGNKKAPAQWPALPSMVAFSIAGIATADHSPTPRYAFCSACGQRSRASVAANCVSPLIFCNAPIPPLSSVLRQNYQSSRHRVAVWCHTVTASCHGMVSRACRPLP